MTVLVVTTADTLAGFDEHEVGRVDSLAGVREGCADATVVVVESLADAAPTAALATVREAAPGTPVIRFGPAADTAEFDHVVSPDGDESLELAVRVALRAADYREAVDALYGQCLSRAAGEGDVRAFYDALTHARHRFEAVRREAGETPYGSLLGPHAPVPPDVAAFREALEGGDEREQ